jgi:hypothetical protein
MKPIFIKKSKVGKYGSLSHGFLANGGKKLNGNVMVYHHDIL